MPRLLSRPAYLQLMTNQELEGVVAHELGHVKNRDILTSSVAATIAAAITFLARMAFWFGGRDGQARELFQTHPDAGRESGDGAPVYHQAIYRGPHRTAGSDAARRLVRDCEKSFRRSCNAINGQHQRLITGTHA